MSTEEIVVLPELKAYIDPLTPDEYEALERSILDEGCRDALVLWGNILVDGHNRYSICQKHGLPFKTMQNTRFQSMEDIHLWMIDQHLGRRSLSDFQRGVLALRKREIIAERRAQAAAAVQAAKAEAGEAAAAEAPWEGETDPVVAKALANVPKVPDEALDTREALARAARLSAGQVKMIETKLRRRWWRPSRPESCRSTPRPWWHHCPWKSSKPSPPKVWMASNRPPSACAKPRKKPAPKNSLKLPNPAPKPMQHLLHP